MPGLRLTHPTLRGVRLTVEVPNRRYTAPMACSSCNAFHERKTYHLDLDGEGAVIVSPEVWGQLQKVPGLELRFSNPVAKPPSRTLALNAKGGYVLRHPTLREVVFVVEIPPKRYTTPYACSRCERTHEAKAYHLPLDAEGSVRVSSQTFEDLKLIDFAGLQVLEAEEVTLNMKGASGSYRVVPHQPRGGK
jgi:hypothetical protein